MTALTHRERAIRALDHEEPDRVPRDLGGMATANVHVNAYGRLVKLLGIEEEVRNTLDPYERRLLMAAPSEAVLQRFDSDFRELHTGATEVVTEERLSDTSYRDEWGVIWQKPEDGHYINVSGPFQKGEPTLADLERHRWPEPRDPGRVRGVKERARQLQQETDCAIVLNLHDGIVGACQRVRGFAEWMEDLLINPALAEGLMEHCTTVSAGIAEFILEEVGEYVDVVMFPDDLGFQDRTYVRPELYRQKIKPYHGRLVEAIKANTRAKVIMHSDGAIYPIIPDLIDIGVDGLNPVQVSAKGMDSQRLKAEFGHHLSFWGGIDTQQVLSWGTPEDVRNEVKTRIHDLAPGGGYVLASVHNIQAEVPPENIVAMFDTALQYGQYGVAG